MGYKIFTGICRWHAFRVSVGTMLLVILLLSSGAGAIPAEEWNMTFGGANYDYAKSVQQTQDRGYIFAGETVSYGDPFGDAWLFKTDANGKEQWNRTFGRRDERDTAYFVQQTPDGGYVLIGQTLTGHPLIGECEKNQKNITVCWDIYPYIYDLWLIKTDAKGNELWNKTFGKKSCVDDGTSYVQQTGDGGYVLATTVLTSLKKGYPVNAWLIKIDAKGNEHWNKTFGGENNSYFSSVQQTSDGGYVLAGQIYFGAGGLYDWVMKTDANGDEEWKKTYGGSITSYLKSVWQTRDGGYALTGWRSYGAGNNAAWLIKTDANGSEQWNRTFGGTGRDDVSSVKLTIDGGYVLSGWTNSYGAMADDAWLIKVGGENSENTPGFSAVHAIVVFSLIYLSMRRR